MIEIESVIKLAAAAIIPAAVSVFLYYLKEKEAIRNMKPITREIIVGVIFGLIAVCGTEFGVAINGVQMNVRDASVIAAGLFFGSWSGVIAGLIGGIERWFSVYWGIGSFTRVACTVSTILAGVFAASLRKWMFEKKRPGLLIASAIGVIIEVFHMNMVFITHMDAPEAALEIVKACTFPMLFANGASLFLTSFFLSFFDTKEKDRRQRRGARISQTIQLWMLIAMGIAFTITSTFVIGFQNLIKTETTAQMLALALNDTAADISDASDQNLLEVAYEVKETLESTSLEETTKIYDIAEISLIDGQGIIRESTVPEYVGYDMRSGEQSEAFLCLLEDEKEYVQAYGPISVNPKVSRKYAGIRMEDGFLQVGYGAKQFQKDIDHEVLNLTMNRHVGQTGYVMIIDMWSHVVSAPRGIKDSMVKSCVRRIVKTEPDTVFRTEIGDASCFCSYRNVEGYIVISVYPQKEAELQRDITIFVNSFMEIMVFGVLYALIYRLINQVVVRQLHKVNESLTKIASGDLDEVVNVQTNHEFSHLSEDINSTVSVLKSYIAEAESRIDKELELAKNIQASALPNVFPAFPKRKDFDIFASMEPAKEVGGDFYDFYLTDPDHISFLIADVSGKGIPAAMFMMRAKTELKRLTEVGNPISDVFTKGNETLCDGNDAGMFVTAWQGTLDLRTGHVVFANAGHNPPLVCRNGSFEYLRSKAGFVLAGMDGVRYKTQEFDLQPGDILYLYTDGVTEATNAASELYGEERLLAAVSSRPFDSMKDLCGAVKADVAAFVGEAPQFDDMTMLGFKYIGIPEAPSIRFKEAALEDIPAVTEFAEEELSKIGCPMKTAIQFSVAIDEIYSNIVRYGYLNRKGPVEVKIVTWEDPRRVDMIFTDEGLPYNPLMKADPDITLSAEEREIGGLGIYMVKKSMDDVLYRYENGQNILTIRKNL